jgi:hypothetical protein
MIKVSNLTESVKTWCGIEIQASGEYIIEETERERWAYDTAFLTALSVGECSITLDDLEITDLVYAEQVLRRDQKRDGEGNPIYRNVIAETKMLFKPRCIDFTVGTYKSLCNKSSNGNDLGDAELLFFDIDRLPLVKDEQETDEAFQARLDSDCVFTWLYLTPSTRYAIKSGEVRYKGTLGDESDIWIEVAPHIPKEYGGSVPFIDGGLPLDFYPERHPIVIDGANCAIIEHDTTYYSHRLGVKVEHGIGSKIEILAIFNMYF